MASPDTLVSDQEAQTSAPETWHDLLSLQNWLPPDIRAVAVATFLQHCESYPRELVGHRQGLFCSSMYAGGISSALEDVTTAVGMVMLLARERRCYSRLHALSRKHYVAALKAVNISIQRAELATSHETLLAVMLLATYETMVLTSQDAEQSFSAHNSGTLELFLFRGREQFKDTKALQLFFHLRRQTILNALWTTDNIPQHFHTLSQWSFEFETDQQRSESKLAALTIRLCELRSQTRRGHYSEAPRRSVVDGFRELDQLLQDWRDHSLDAGDSYDRHIREEEDVLTAACHEKPMPPAKTPLRLDYLTTRLQVNQSLRDVLKEEDLLAESDSMCALLRTISDFRRQARTCIEKMLSQARKQDTDKPSGNFALQRLAIWPLWVVGSDEDASLSDLSWILLQLHAIAKDTGCLAARRVADAIFQKTGTTSPVGPRSEAIPVRTTKPKQSGHGSSLILDFHEQDQAPRKANVLALPAT
ncbi:uncharacterized protein LTR77_010720 [Saxophila tyrrhenica]|uniref:Uncharacterized protein n=1 Tax=Saxophila tyrrhenica TaxID=1690608 RepID=A0AAV9NYG5_9PEZI|nr:hypothetical protein LTR77_010720 [Saxophila tyrrhenica]